MLLVIFLVGGTAALANLFRGDFAELIEAVKARGDDQRPYESKSGNFRFRFPGVPWQKELDVERDLGANLALRRTDPNAWFALLFIDYQKRMPRQDEVLRIAVRRLRGYFRGLEWEQRSEVPLAGRSAHRIVFQGERDNIAMSGECLILVHQGLAYWFFSWTPASGDLEAAQQEWADLREGFVLLKERDGWTVKSAKLLPAQGSKGYTFHFPEDLWEALEPSDGFDVVLLGRDPEDPKDTRRTATIRVQVLDEQPDLDSAMKEARARAEAYEKVAFKDVKIEPVPGAEKSGLPEGNANLGRARAQVARLRMNTGEGRVRFLAMAVVPRPGYTLAVYCECAWEHREAWEERFGPVLHSLRFDRR